MRPIGIKFIGLTFEFNLIPNNSYVGEFSCNSIVELSWYNPDWVSLTNYKRVSFSDWYILF